MSQMTFRVIPIEQLEPHPLADRVLPDKQARVLAAWIKRTGVYPPVVVMCDPAGERAGRYVILDGRSRVAALKRLKHPVVQCMVFHVCGAEALWLLATLNTLHGCEDPPTRGELLRRLGLPPEQLGPRLGQDARAIRRFMNFRQAG